MYALIDCNNFFVSCERVFRPDLTVKPVVVLSSNDGCVVSRSAEAKKLGIPMGVPHFQYREEFIKQNITVFSGNFDLYANFSNRVMNSLETFSNQIEIYSIDEAFLSLPPALSSVEYGQEISNTLEKWTKIPISVGIADTKVLAKAASFFAKKTPALKGVCKIDKNNCEEFLRQMPVGEVWGIGQASARLLHDKRIDTAWDLAQAPNQWVRKNITLHGLSIAQELRGEAIFVEDGSAPKKGVVCSRSFGKGVTSLSELREAVVAYAANLGKKLRDEKEQAGYLYIFVRSGKSADMRFASTLGTTLPVPTSFSPALIKAAVALLEKIYKPGIVYRKVGVGCTGLLPEGSTQQNLFVAANPLKEKKLMKAMDSLNRSFGQETVRFAGSGFKRAWKAREQFRSRRYVSRINELPTVS